MLVVCPNFVGVLLGLAVGEHDGPRPAAALAGAVALLSLLPPLSSRRPATACVLRTSAAFLLLVF
jgi:hypothetical protein